MGKIIAVANQKGGVGKTTSAVNLAASLGVLGKTVLMVDVDPQGNATSGLGVNKKDITVSSYDLMIGRLSASQAVISTEFERLDLIPANINLAGAEIELVEMEGRLTALKQAVVGIKPQYDFILIDCPPSLGLITLNALSLCDTVLIPIQCEYYALEGLSQLIATLRQVKQKYNDTIEIEGVLVTMYDARLNLTTQVLEEVKRFFPQQIYHTTIPRNVRLSEAPSFGQPIYYYDRGSRGAKAYLDLAKEIIAANA